MKRRDFLVNVSGSLLAGGVMSSQLFNPFKSLANEVGKDPYFTRRGLTIWVEDLLNWDWVQKAYNAGMNTIATHHDPEEIVGFIKSEQGQKFMSDCKRLGIGVEHSLHAYSALVPRELFDTDPDLFRMNSEGVRTPDANFCVSNKHTLEVIRENAVKYATLLPSTTGRYFYTADDAKELCSCPRCSMLKPSEQTLIVQNNIIQALRKHVNPDALISHAAYVHTLSAPVQITPEPGVFLEWAPITRIHDRPIADREANDGIHGRLVDHLYENMEVFGNENSQVFEYWFDSYRASGWKTKEENWDKAPWNPEVLREDLAFYEKVGIKSVTSVTCWISQGYVDRFGEPPLKEYGMILGSYRSKR